MDSVMKLIEMIAGREGFGDILADGVAKASERLGKGREIAMHVEGLEMIQVDPRGLKGYGLGFAVASRGADHLRSEPFIELSDDPQDRRGYVRGGGSHSQARGKGEGEISGLL
jgi:aldehyde:ferredoxin oxidoreductase